MTTPMSTEIEAEQILTSEQHRNEDLKILQPAASQLQNMLDQRETENRKLGIWISENIRHFSKPLLSSEVVNSTRINIQNRNMDIFDKINDEIKGNLLLWVEESLNR
jgi:hypothetical protein